MDKAIQDAEKRLEILQRVQGFIDAANKIFEEQYKKNNYTFEDPPKLTIRNGKTSGDWIALDKPRSVYCWIRMTDGSTKTLGTLRAGDIHRPATYRAPAKHARGNVFEDDFGAHCAGPHGVQYLR